MQENYCGVLCEESTVESCGPPVLKSASHLDQIVVYHCVVTVC